MDREGIRRLAAEQLGVRTSPYKFASNETDYRAAVERVGMPCIVKPVMSSSGKGQSTVRTAGDIDASWQYAVEGARGAVGTVIVEGFVDFDYEITLLTIRHRNGTTFCAPVVTDGDYQESWQPQVSEKPSPPASKSPKIHAALVDGASLGSSFLSKTMRFTFRKLVQTP